MNLSYNSYMLGSFLVCLFLPHTLHDVLDGALHVTQFRVLREEPHPQLAIGSDGSEGLLLTVNGESTERVVLMEGGVRIIVMLSYLLFFEVCSSCLNKEQKRRTSP